VYDRGKELNMVDFLCVAGQMRSGKNVVGDHLCARLGFQQASFAKPVKDIFCRAFSADIDFVEAWKIKDQPPPGFKRSVRQALQFIGDGFREISPDVWVEYAFANNPAKSCFTDGRYVNELKKVRSSGGLNILLWRPKHENNDSNESEAQIKRIVDWFIAKRIRDCRVPADVSSDASAPLGCGLVDFFIVNEGTIHDLHVKIDELVVSRLQA
jgi:hypothetical protein